MGNILSVEFSQKLSSVGTLLLCKICLSLLGMIWYYQKIEIAMTRFVKIGKFFLLWKSKLSEVTKNKAKNKFCNCLNMPIVSLTTVLGSHECPHYHTVHLKGL